MKKEIIYISAFLMAGCAALPKLDSGAKISVFASAIEQVVAQRGVSYEQAGDMLKQVGVTGFDVHYASKNMERYLASGMKPVNFYGKVNLLNREEAAKDTKKFLDAADKYGVKMVMLLPCHFSSDKADRDAEVEMMIPQVKSFVEQAKARGITATIEDFGYLENPCSYAKYISRFLEAVPDLRFAVDSGNLYCVQRGDDIYALTCKEIGRVSHVHLKDYDPKYAKDLPKTEKYVTVGLGAIPNREVVEAVKQSGYNGWYTLENPVGKDTYDDIVRQAALLNSWMK